MNGEQRGESPLHSLELGCSPRELIGSLNGKCSRLADLDGFSQFRRIPWISREIYCAISTIFTKKSRGSLVPFVCWATVIDACESP